MNFLFDLTLFLSGGYLVHVAYKKGWADIIGTELTKAAERLKQDKTL